jgi:hypothetical protein
LKKGIEALGALTTVNDGGQNAEITSFKSGTSLKVRIKGTDNIANYFNYGIFRVVNSFIPQEPAERNEKGFVVSNPSPWDKAAQYYQDLANKTADKDEQEKLKAEARLYRGKEKYLMGFYELSEGKDIVVDLTKAQALGVYQTIKKYEKKLDKFAFELSKTGQSTSTTVSLSLLVDMDEDLDDKERANFEKSSGEPFNSDLFDGVLYEMNEAEQIENLVKAGFDVNLIGLSAQGNEVTPVNDAKSDVDPTEAF